MLKFSNHLKFSLQAAISVLAAVILSHLFHLSHAYWAILTAMLLISQTFGESIKKSIERVSMTILGGCLGTVIYLLSAHTPHLLYCYLIISVFFAMYFFDISYAISVFFITMMLVFMFGLILGWDLHTLKDRVEETLIGAGIAIATSAMVFPMRAKNQFQMALPEFMQTCHQALTDTLASLTQKDFSGQPLEKHQKNLIKNLVALRAQGAAASYESFFSRYSRAHLQKLLIAYSMIFYYIDALIDLAPHLKHHKSFRILEQEIARLYALIDAHFQAIAKALAQQTNTPKPLPEFSTLFKKIEHHAWSLLLAHQLEKTDWFECYPWFYLLEKMDEVLLQILDLV